MHLELISRYPKTQTKPTPLLFVHGAWHGAWCWEEHFLGYFAERGYASHALSLRGHGKSDGPERLRWTRLSEYVADVERVVSGLEGTPVLIGHSMGGAVVQKYLETRTAQGGVLLASVPPVGVLGASLRLARRHPIAFARTNLTLSLYPLIGTPHLTREAFFSASMPPETVQRYYSLMQDEGYLGFLDMLGLNLLRPKRVTTPMLVLGAAEDMIFSRHESMATAKAYNTVAIIFPDTAHDMMLEACWQAVADRIIEWLAERRME